MNNALPDDRLLDEIYRHYNEEDGFEFALIRYKIAGITPHLYGSSLLDMGCGVGLLCNAFADRFSRIVGVDGSALKIARARQMVRHPHVEFVNAMFDEFFTTERFDTILATNVLEHMTDPGTFLSHLINMLAPGGQIILTVPNAMSLHKRIGKQLGMIRDYLELTAADLEKGHHQVYTRETLAATLQTSGLQLTCMEGILLKPLSNRQMESFDPHVCDALYEIGKELPDYCSSILAVASIPSGDQQ